MGAAQVECTEDELRMPEPRGIGHIWEPLSAHLGPAREEGRRATRGEVGHWCARHGNRADTLAELSSSGEA